MGAEGGADGRVDGVGDGRRRRGDRTRERVLRAAVPLATVHGVEGFSFGDVAAASGVRKPTIAALFGSKHDLQLAVVERAQQTLEDRVFAPVRAAPRGVAQLEALGRCWLDHLEDPELVGGCFFAATCVELDSRPGPLHDLIGAAMTRWIDGIARIVADGQARGEIVAHARPDDEALVFFSFGVTANTLIQLGSPADAALRARRNWDVHVDRLRTPSPEDPS